MIAPTVPAPLPPTLPDRLSMTFVQNAGKCLRMADLDRRVDTSGWLAIVGRIMHEIAARAGQEASAGLREQLPPERIEAIGGEVLRASSERIAPLSEEGWQRVRDLTARFAESHYFPLGTRVEQDFRTRFEGRVFSARIDVYRVDGPVGYVTDYKSGERRPQQSDPPVTFQGRNYAWHVRAAFPDVERFEVGEEFLAHGIRRPPATILAEELDEHEDYLADQVARLELAYAQAAASGRGLATQPGSWCDNCPDRVGCPLPPWAQGASIRSAEDAERALGVVVQQRAASRALVADLRTWVESEDNPDSYVRSGDMEAAHWPKGEGSEFAIRKATRTEEAR